jgi:hypothetical protein
MRAAFVMIGLDNYVLEVLFSPGVGFTLGLGGGKRHLYRLILINIYKEHSPSRS